MKTKTIVIILLALSLTLFFSCKKSSIEATKWGVEGPDKELAEGLRQKVKRDSINRTPEQIEARKKQQEENAQIKQSRADAIRQMREAGDESTKYYDDELVNKKKWGNTL